MVADYLLDLGIKMDIINFDLSDVGFLFRKEFQSALADISAYGDPDRSYLFWNSSQDQKGFNIWSYSNADVDRWLERGRRAPNPLDRKRAYDRFQEAILGDPPGIFLYWTNTFIEVQKRFRGVRINPAHPFDDIREWYVPKSDQRYAGLNR